VATQETIVNYFEYNENRYMRKPGESSKTQLDVIEPPDYWIIEHGRISDVEWARLAGAGFLCPQAEELIGKRTVGFNPVFNTEYGNKCTPGS
jgi:hypothetical protein